MNEQMLMMIINAGITLVMQLISFGQQLYGKAAIPDLDVILLKNKALQDKIDAEKVKE